MTAPDDSQLADLLDGYLSQLHAGQRPDRAALLREHPELAAPLKCIEALDGLVPPADSDFAPATQLFEDGPLSDADARNGTEAVPYSLPRDFGPYELLAEVGRGGWEWSTRRGKRRWTASWPSK